MTQKTITVLGAGITGLWQALYLARAGHKVRLIEAASDPFAKNASALAAAMLAPFCESESAEPVVRELGILALPIWRQHLPQLQQRGSLVVAGPRDQAELNRMARMTTGHERVDQDCIAKLEPDLAGRFATALFFPNEAHMAPVAALEELLRQVRDGGGAVSLGTPWPPKHGTGDDTSDFVIDCRGLAARQDLPVGAPALRGVRGERILIRSKDVSLSRPLRLLHPRHAIYVVPWPHNNAAESDDGTCYMVGATVIESEDPGPMTLRSALELLGTAYALHPGFGEAEILGMAAGLRPAFPDNAPKIIPSGRHIHVNGMYRHGFLTAPALARLVGDYIASDATRDDVFVML